MNQDVISEFLTILKQREINVSIRVPAEKKQERSEALLLITRGS
jgi:hypothetical protein